MITEEKRAEWKRLMDLPERSDPCPQCGHCPHRALPDGGGHLALKCQNCGADVLAAWEAQYRIEEEAEGIRHAMSAATLARTNAAKTQALDFTTIAHCFRTLETAFRSALQWESINDQQRRFFTWLSDNADKIQYLCGLQGMTSFSYEELNAFLVEHGFDPKFQPFEGMGVVSILDLLVSWVESAFVKTIDRGDKEYPGFKIVADIFSVQGHDRHMARLATRSGHSLWITIASEPVDGFDLALTAQFLASAPKTSSHSYDGIVMPKLEIDIEPDLEWLKGARTAAWNHSWQVDQAFQMFKLRLNEKGARVKVATGLSVAMAAPAPPPTLIFDQPFIGYFTHPGLDDLPIAAFYAGVDSWKEPGGSLEEL